jgi:hypothetical protein
LAFRLFRRELYNGKNNQSLLKIGECGSYLFLKLAHSKLSGFEKFKENSKILGTNQERN